MRYRLAVMLVANALAAVVASGQDAVTIKLKERGEGESILIYRAEVRTFKLTILDAKGKAEEFDRSFDVKEYRETILKRDAARLPIKLEREYTKAQFSKGGVTQNWPIVGKVIVIEKRDDRYAFAFHDGAPLPGPALDALAREFSRNVGKETDFEKLMLPKGPVKPGDRWLLDMAPIVKHMTRGGELDVTAVNAKGSGTLLETRKQDGRLFGIIAYELEIPVKAMGKVRFNDGARIVSGIKMDLCIDGTSDVGTIKSTITILGEASPAKGVLATVNIVDDLTQIRREAPKK